MSLIFQWPGNKRAAISLTFDDARLSQPDTGFALLESFDAKATFYVSFGSLEKRLDRWKLAIEQGHEIGNHSVTHPCSGNFPWARSKALEDFTLDRMETEMLDANARIHSLLGVTPTTFAYPCGQKFVGRGEHTKSYVALVAKHFKAGRGFRDESTNDPAFCDPAQLFGVDLDNLSFDELLPVVNQTVDRGGWLVLAGHEIGDHGPQTTRVDTLSRLCQFCLDDENRIWLDTVDRIASQVIKNEKCATPQT
jgi:peptidoglycan/xylan/chitin deacetylase (PgdA/CDA1 family)